MTESLDHRFTKFLLEAQALKFGEFTLKSGRKSPYFINAGAFNDGRKDRHARRILCGEDRGGNRSRQSAERHRHHFSVLPTRAFRWASPPRSL